MSGRRIGILGGSFDPIHLGHLIIAQEACEQLQLERALFVPASQAPLRDAAPVAAAAQRLEMVRRAIADNPRFAVSTTDLDAGGTSYSIDTARRLQADNPGAELHWILGADQLAQLGRWRDIEALCAIARFVAFERDFDAKAPREQFAALPANCRLTRLRGLPFSVSSSEIRRRIAAGQEVKYFLHPYVFDFIKADYPYGPMRRVE